MRRASAVACAAIIGVGALLANQVPAQMVRHVDGQGPEAFPPREVPRAGQQPPLPEPTVEGTVAELSSEPGPAAQQPTVEDQAGQMLGRRIREARQHQCNAEWEQYHQARAEFCKLPDRGIGEARCPLDILGYEPPAPCQ
jgi:hypothetical protein